ncbi:MAG: recombinase RecD [Cycloclasticus sp. symbiont of Bathymodiolus heckerae]|nr:MAG: recombinase RecD [Cycloclasticus sp. symbiont of Bathymodiolus heckerae]
MNTITEVLTGIVNRVTYHNPTTGWSVLRVQPFQSPQQQETVTVHQTKVFAGATMEFRGAWTIDHKYGRQFKATEAIEKKPATTAAIEKYLGSGLIKGVGPQTAKRIVKYFQKDTLDIFENDIQRLTEVPGIATKKLKTIEEAWTEHRAIREVMMFLQGHGISTLFAVRIYKQYGDKAIAMVTEDPYRLANDFYGIGFFSADKVALSIGLSKDSQQRMVAAIKHVLAASREQGHCYLTEQQINMGIVDLIEMSLGERLNDYLGLMKKEGQLCTRLLIKEGIETTGYYSKTLYYDETTVATILRGMHGSIASEPERIASWISHYCQSKSIALSDEQADAVKSVVQHRFSVLTGGPGCGKTTTTLVIVRLLEAMKKSVLLAAPTGRASQRMSEVIGREAKTIHRLLEWKGGEFQMNEESKLKTDFLIVDECSMLDISLTASLLKAVPDNCQVLFIGDPDQLPSVGAGNVLKDIISSDVIPCFRLTQVFRQAKESLIIQYAHQINKGETPYIASPFKSPAIWKNGADCLFIDSDEATQEQLGFISRVKRHFDWQLDELENLGADKVNHSPFEFRIEEAITSAYEVGFVVPDKFKHVNLEQLTQTDAQIDALKSVVKKIHPWSSLHYGLSAVDSVVKLYLEWIPKYHGADTEIQILTPMTRGSLGSANLNKVIQEKANPPHPGKCQLKVGERIFREGDRVIHRRNNYDLNVFNGDIGKIITINNEELNAMVSFYPDNREVHYKKEDIMELDLAYAITIHKSQGSEFKAVIIPLLTQHFKMLYRNLIYTGLTRAKDLAVFVGTRRALSMAIQQQDVSQRQTALELLIKA